MSTELEKCLLAFASFKIDVKIYTVVLYVNTLLTLYVEKRPVFVNMLTEINQHLFTHTRSI